MKSESCAGLVEVSGSRECYQLSYSSILGQIKRTRNTTPRRAARKFEWIKVWRNCGVDFEMSVVGWVFAVEG